MESKRILNNLIWRFLERCGAQGVSFIVSIILARLLEPKVYGIIALVTVFTAILQVFVDSGFGNALIQKKNADDMDFSTVFYFNLTICIALYFVMFSVAPLISRFYDMPELLSVVRVVSLVIVISGVKNVQQAYVSRNMLFKRFFFSTLGGTICAAVIGITMAYLGFGVWALVAQLLANTTIDTLILWITVKWRPKKMFSVERLKGLFSYGWKLLVSQLLTVIYRNFRQIIIGKMYSSEDLAFYNHGDKIPNLIVTNINTSIDNVLFSALSSEQDSIERVKKMTRRAIKTSSYIMMPLMMEMAVCADSLVSIVLTDKWLPCVPYLRVFCFIYAFYPIHTANLNAINAVGHSDIYLKLEIIKDAVGLSFLILTMRFGVMAIALGFLVSTAICQVVNAWPNRRLLNYRYFEQLKDMLPQMVLSCVMGAAIYCVKLLHLNAWLTLIIQIPLGIFIYIAVSRIFKIDSFEYVLKIVRGYFHK